MSYYELSYALKGPYFELPPRRSTHLDTKTGALARLHLGTVIVDHLPRARPHFISHICSMICVATSGVYALHGLAYFDVVSRLFAGHGASPPSLPCAQSKIALPHLHGSCTPVAPSPRVFVWSVLVHTTAALTPTASSVRAIVLLFSKFYSIHLRAARFPSLWKIPILWHPTSLSVPQHPHRARDAQGANRVCRSCHSHSTAPA
ncbi:hypothetical protein K438DRAFT_1989906 [Mycena galopus ATCC 62051]|nr:hypothetical protein K438DRAFT_1989906 [Mycena galopus ATCC 62051]